MAAVQRGRNSRARQPLSRPGSSPSRAGVKREVKPVFLPVSVPSAIGAEGADLPEAWTSGRSKFICEDRRDNEADGVGAGRK